MMRNATIAAAFAYPDGQPRREAPAQTVPRGRAGGPWIRPVRRHGCRRGTPRRLPARSRWRGRGRCRSTPAPVRARPRRSAPRHLSALVERRTSCRLRTRCGTRRSLLADAGRAGAHGTWRRHGRRPRRRIIWLGVRPSSPTTCLLVASAWLSALAVHALVRRLTADTAAAFCAGAIWGFCPASRIAARAPDLLVAWWDARGAPRAPPRSTRDGRRWLALFGVACCCRR
mgnify:CR=1 FL=1